MFNTRIIDTALSVYPLMFLTLSAIVWWLFSKPVKRIHSPPALPQAPKYMTPLEAQFVMLKTVDARGLFATLLDWAKRGIVQINWGNPLHKVTYTYTITPNATLNTKHERILYQAIFLDGKRTAVTQEQVNFVLHKKWRSIRRIIQCQFGVGSQLSLYRKSAVYTNLFVFMGAVIGYTLMSSYYMAIYIGSELWSAIILGSLFSMMYIASASNTWLSLDKFLNKGIAFRTSKSQRSFIRIGNLIGACVSFAFSMMINSVLAFVFTSSVWVFAAGMLYHLATATLIIRPRFSPLGEKFYVALKDYQTYLIDENEHIDVWINENPLLVLEQLPFSVALGAYEGVFVETMIEMQRWIER